MSWFSKASPLLLILMWKDSNEPQIFMANCQQAFHHWLSQTDEIGKPLVAISPLIGHRMAASAFS